ncbi:response regulator transcription factor [Streptosporangium sp. 'caverna']|uniref:response regulator transcription factor n=1 Tax=Streptosporangium sp. 'caverna' TaxID=2202249 RepID=UPI000D7DC774|nr:response regulator transcription factor [Streptosporangium sp. 'caverna']AWS40761.1 DNA-binding response regulator [Streptosporangium sp. 'caverna']
MCAYVLVAEDDLKQAELVRRYLEREGHTVVAVHDGRSALDAVRRRLPDLLVLDVMMPKVDGLDVCRILRAESDLPMLMLTARTTEDDLLLGLDLGADDYMTKPYSPRELMARVRTLLRRTRPVAAGPDPVLRVGALAVDPNRHEVSVEGRRIECTPGEFEILELLATQPGRVFTREQILGHLHGFDRYITSRTVDVHVMNLRKKVEPEPRRPVRLVTVYGVGYKLTGGTQDPEDAENTGNGMSGMDGRRGTVDTGNGVNDRQGLHDAP